MADHDWADPGREAMTVPEPASPGPVAHAIGVGPGDPAFLTRRARTLLDEADVLVGFETVLDVVEDSTDAGLLRCGYDDQSAVLATFGDRVATGESGLAVLSGDPNVSGYQFVGRVERAVDGPVRVVPGVSAVQVAASRARTPLEHATVVSLHRRGSLDAALDRLAAAAASVHLLCLPRPADWMPEDVAEFLLESGVATDRPAMVCERLTTPAETLTRTTLGDLAGDAGGDGSASSRFSDLSVIVVRAPVPKPVSAGVPERST